MVIKVGPRAPADLAAFLRPYASLVSRGQSRHAMERYTAGLLADIPRKTASDLGRGVAGTNGQRLQEFLTNTEWDSREMDLLRVQYMVTQASLGRGLQIIDDTGFAKKGTHSVGVARQYSGTLGRVDNCQVLVTSHYVDGSFDWPITARLYLPEGWTQDQLRLRGAKVPAGTFFQTKGEIALELIDAGIAAAVPTEAVLADAGYGDQPQFLEGLEARGLPYLVGVASSTRFRLARDVEEDPGEQPAPPYQGRVDPDGPAVWRTGYQAERPLLFWKNCPKMPGKLLPGGKGARAIWPRSSLECGFTGLVVEANPSLVQVGLSGNALCRGIKESPNTASPGAWTPGASRTRWSWPTTGGSSRGSTRTPKES